MEGEPPSRSEGVGWSIALSGTALGFLAGGFAYGIRNENKKFRELEAMRRAKGGEVPIPAHGLAGRAFLYGTMLCGIGALAGWMVVQYSLGVRNLHEFSDAMRVLVPEKSAGLRRFFESIPVPFRPKKAAQQADEEAPSTEEDRHWQEWFRQLEEEDKGQGLTANRAEKSQEDRIESSTRREEAE
mmetsp:Transcript_3833/g.12122  ORF Transcript_3833/g.12122 Transcript_3833/m.12122 type:complete len:185 (-) Transcript_3833:14-568(-)